MKRSKNIRRFASAAILLAGVGLQTANPAGAQTLDQLDRADFAPETLFNTVVMDNIFIFIAGVLVLFMQAGFAMVEAGFTEAKNAANIMMKNIMDVSVGMLFFGLIGWNIAYSGANVFGVADGAWSKFGVSGMTNLFPADALDYSLAVPVDWFFQAAFAATAATIVSGAVSGRTQFKGYLLYSIVLTAIIYPIVVNWKWGGGWLDQLGFVDFAGSGLVHMVGGFAALMGAIILGPRIAKFDNEGKPRTINGHSTPLAILGVFILFVGWFGFNPGSQLAADMAVPYIAVLTAFAAAAGATGGMVTSWITMKKPDVGMAGNGMLAGLVAICSGIGNFSVVGTVATGLVGGIVVVLAVSAVEGLKIDDPVGAFSVHGVAGFWGLIATGLFATSGSPVDGSLEGLFYGGGTGLLLDQFVGGIAIAVFVVVTTGALFMAIRAAGLLRVSVEEELAGLDVSEHGAPAYTLNLQNTMSEDSTARLMTS